MARQGASADRAQRRVARRGATGAWAGWGSTRRGDSSHRRARAGGQVGAATRGGRARRSGSHRLIRRGEGGWSRAATTGPGRRRRRRRRPRAPRSDGCGCVGVGRSRRSPIRGGRGLAAKICEDTN